MASLIQWVWVNSGSWWWTGRPGKLQSMGWRRVGHDWATELNWEGGENQIHFWWGCTTRKNSKCDKNKVTNTNKTRLGDIVCKPKQSLMSKISTVRNWLPLSRWKPPVSTADMAMEWGVGREPRRLREKFQACYDVAGPWRHRAKWKKRTEWGACVHAPQTPTAETESTLLAATGRWGQRQERDCWCIKGLGVMQIV